MDSERPELRAQTERSTEPIGYGVMLAIYLPRDELSVPVIRHLVGDALTQVGVLAEITSDIQLALTEACTNVLDHSGPGDAYEVTVTIDPKRCELRIIDLGHGFDHTNISAPAKDGNELIAERGRGLELMKALVDHIELVSEPEEGTLVRLVKNLAFDQAAPAQQLLLRALQGGTARNGGDSSRSAP